MSVSVHIAIRQDLRCARAHLSCRWQPCDQDQCAVQPLRRLTTNLPRIRPRPCAAACTTSDRDPLPTHRQMMTCLMLPLVTRHTPACARTCMLVAGSVLKLGSKMHHAQLLAKIDDISQAPIPPAQPTHTRQMHARAHTTSTAWLMRKKKASVKVVIIFATPFSPRNLVNSNSAM